MEPLILVAGAAVACIGVLWSRVREGRQRRFTWRQAAVACDVTGLPATSAWLGDMTGRAGGLDVTFSEYRVGKNRRGTRVAVECPGSALDRLTLRPEGVSTALGK